MFYRFNKLGRYRSSVAPALNQDRRGTTPPPHPTPPHPHRHRLMILYFFAMQLVTRQQVRGSELPIRFAISRRDGKKPRTVALRRGAGTSPPWIMYGQCVCVCVPGPGLCLCLCHWMTDKSRSLSRHGPAPALRHGMAAAPFSSATVGLHCTAVSLSLRTRIRMPTCYESWCHKRALVVFFLQKPIPTCCAHAVGDQRGIKGDWVKNYFISPQCIIIILSSN